VFRGVADAVGAIRFHCGAPSAADAFRRVLCYFRIIVAFVEDLRLRRSPAQESLLSSRAKAAVLARRDPREPRVGG